MIRLENVTKIYRTENHRKMVLDRVSLTLDSKRSYGLLGPNGAGKSTLLRLIAGTDLPNRGRVIRTARVSWPLGFAGGFHGGMTGRENVAFVARIYGAKVPEVIEFVEDFAEIGSYFDVPMKSYSSGMQQRLAFALSMAIDFDTYLVDEVMAVGDSRFQMRCVEAFNERRARSGMIVVSHDIGTIRVYCTHCMVLHNANITVFENVDDGIEFYQTNF